MIGFSTIAPCDVCERVSNNMMGAVVPRVLCDQHYNITTGDMNNLAETQADERL